jgi:hypothetical protein
MLVYIYEIYVSLVHYFVLMVSVMFLGILYGFYFTEWNLCMVVFAFG